MFTVHLTRGWLPTVAACLCASFSSSVAHGQAAPSPCRWENDSNFNLCLNLAAAPCLSALVPCQVGCFSAFGACDTGCDVVCCFSLCDDAQACIDCQNECDSARASCYNACQYTFTQCERPISQACVYDYADPYGTPWFVVTSPVSDPIAQSNRSGTPRYPYLHLSEFGQHATSNCTVYIDSGSTYANPNGRAPIHYNLSGVFLVNRTPENGPVFITP